MSGICGVWNLDGRPVEKALLARLSARLAHRGSDAEGLWIEGAIGLACHLHRVTPQSSTETQPLLDSSGAVVVFDGRLDNREEVLASVDPTLRIIPDAPDPAVVLAAYRTFGDPFPERLKGDFALGLFDPSRQQLLLARDAIGIRPLYYARAGDTFVFASEIKAILAHPRVSAQPNDDLLADFLLDGARDAQGMTFFNGVLSLVPAHVAILTARGFLTRRYWDFDCSRQVRLESFAEYVEAFRDHFTCAVRRRLRSAHPVAVSVSGGLDSSSIFCLAETLRRQSPGRYPSLLGISYTSPDGTPSDEKVFLLEIERQYGIAIGRVPMSPPGFVDRAAEVVWHVEAPFLDEQWNTTHAFLGTLKRLGASVLLTGQWGDQLLFDQAYLIDLVRGLRWRAVWTHLNEFGRWFTDAEARYFRRRFVLDLVKYHVPAATVPLLRRLRSRQERPWYAKALRKRARQRAFRQRPPGIDFASAHARALYEEARSSRHVLCMDWNNKVAAMHGLEMAFPFLDQDLVGFLMSVPGDLQTWRGVPKALLREGLRGVLPAAIALRNWKADFTHLVNQALEREYPQLAQCLGADAMAVRAGYADWDVMRTALAQMKDRLRGSSCDNAWSLSDLLGLELWLRVFFGRHSNGNGSPGTPEALLRASAQGGAG